MPHPDAGPGLDEALLRLASRLDAEERPYIAVAARQAALAVQVGTPSASALRTASLRRQAIEVALELDMLGLPADAQAVFDEVIRRATQSADAMPDPAFKAWLDAIVAQFDIRP